MTLLFGLVIVPLGSFSTFFIIIQPVVIGTWCSLCLPAAGGGHGCDDPLVAGLGAGDGAAPVAQPPGRRAVLAQLLPGRITAWRRVREGVRPLVSLRRHDARFPVGWCDFPWTLLACAAVGVWLMFTRATLSVNGPMAASDHVTGRLVCAATSSLPQGKERRCGQIGTHPLA
jgi:hypothetical protein